MGNTHAPERERHRQRRLSAPDDQVPSICRLAVMSVSLSTTPLSTTPPPRIQINGTDSTDDEENELHNDPPQSTASFRRLQFLTSSTIHNTARSFDDSASSPDVRMKPLSRAKSHSPLKKMRTYSYRSLNSEENVLDPTSCELIKQSWTECVAKGNEQKHPFGYFVFQRIFQKHPNLKPLFNVPQDKELGELGDEHEAVRHTRIFTNIIQLAVKSVDELEAQVAPAIFKYGERHFTPKVADHMTEENVRMVCAQVVCSVVDLLGDDAQPETVEAWIEMMRYLGRKLLDGFEYAKLSSKHHLSFGRHDHHVFLML